MEKPSRRRGDNLYPVTLETQLGGYSLNLDVPAGVWNPTPNGIHLGNMLAQMSFSGEQVLGLGTGCGIHAIIIARQGAHDVLHTGQDFCASFLPVCGVGDPLHLATRAAKLQQVIAIKPWWLRCSGEGTTNRTTKHETNKSSIDHCQGCPTQKLKLGLILTAHVSYLNIDWV